MEKLSYKELVKSIRAFRILYDGILCSFSYYELHDKVIFIGKIKQGIYSLKMSNYKKDKIWEYLNHDITYDILQKIK